VPGRTPAQVFYGIMAFSLYIGGRAAYFDPTPFGDATGSSTRRVYTKGNQDQIMTDQSFDEVVQIVREAGEMACGYFRRVAVERKPDRSFVTAADRDIESFLRAGLLAQFPDTPVIGEEHGLSGDVTGDRPLWAIDPIDGTECFVQGLPLWGISVGLMEAGKPACGVFYMPVMDELYAAAPDGPPTLNGAPLSVYDTDRFDPESVLFVTSAAHRRYRIDFEGKTRSLGSTAAHIAFTAGGRGIGALLGRPHIWDIAGALAVLLRLGGQCVRLSGEPFDFREILHGDIPGTPLMAGPPRALALLRNRVTPLSRAAPGAGRADSCRP
jgi:myo-inositol-1(or 4)-monophosphatase